MPFTSYAQNLEDVILWRALKHVTNGRYVDVGAQHPIIDSVSKAFYERGWRGIHVEPVQLYADLIRKDRPDETVLQVALADFDGVLELNVFPDTGLSTAVKAYADQNATDLAMAHHVEIVPALRISSAMKSLIGQEVHWLKIDVEGFEEQVLKGWDSQTFRPWIILIEATVPRSTELHFAAADELLIKAGYQFTYFDGINRFYLAPEHADLSSRLAIPPNFFDDVHLSGTSGTWCRGVNAKHEAREALWAQRLAEAERQVDEANARALARITEAESQRHQEKLDIERALTRAAKAELRAERAVALQVQTERRASHAEAQARQAAAVTAQSEQLVAQAQARAVALEQRLTAILNTDSWRITAPGRWLRVRLRDFDKRLRKTRLVSGLKRQIKGKRAAPATGVRTAYADWIERFDTLRNADRELIAAHIERSSLGEVAVIWMIDTKNEAALCNCFESLRRQIHPRWTCLVILGQAIANLSKEGFTATNDDRITVCDKWSDERGAVLQGRPVLLLQGAGMLAEHAIYMFAAATARGDVNAFSDVDHLSKDGTRQSPRFGPRYSAEFAGVANIGMTPFSADIAQLCRDERYSGAELSRTLAGAFGKAQVAPTHMPFVLFHSENNTHDDQPTYRSDGLTDSEDVPTISIIIPTRDRLDLLEPCISSILQKTDYPKEKYEIIVVDNGSTETRLLDYIETLERQGSITVIHDASKFNYSRINNGAVKASSGELVTFVNNDVVVNDHLWLRRLAIHARNPSIGGVGSKLLYPDMTVQHGGVILGIQGLAAHAHHHLQSSDPGYMGLNRATHAISAVTGACLMMKRRVFDEIGGFDEQLAVAFNDVLLCLAAMSRGYRNIYVAEPLLIHFESKTRGLDDTEAKQKIWLKEARYARSKFRSLFKADPFYSENLSLEKVYDLAFPPRMQKPWHRFRRESSGKLNIIMLSCTHQIGHGVAVVIDQQARHLAEQGHTVFIGGPVSNSDFAYPGCHRVPLDGPKEAAEFAMQHGMDCVVMHTPPFYSAARWLGTGVKTLGYDYGEPNPEFFSDAAARRAVLIEKAFCLEMADALYAISDAVKDESDHERMGVIELGNSHLASWNEGSLSRRESARQKRRWADDKVIVLNVCRFHRAERDYKGIDAYCAVRDQFIRDYPGLASNFMFCLAGKGNEDDILEMELRGLVVYPNVSDTELVDLYLCADLYANFSKWEGYNLGIGQALAMGVPVVASDIPAHRSFGVSIVQDAASAAAKLHELAEIPDQVRSARLVPWSDHLEKFSSIVTALCLDESATPRPSATVDVSVIHDNR